MSDREWVGAELFVLATIGTLRTSGCNHLEKGFAGHHFDTEGGLRIPKRINFWKSSERPLPPPSFLENHIVDFCLKFMTEVPFKMAKICNINFWI